MQDWHILSMAFLKLIYSPPACVVGLSWAVVSAISPALLPGSAVPCGDCVRSSEIIFFSYCIARSAIHRPHPFVLISTFAVNQNYWGTGATLTTFQFIAHGLSSGLAAGRQNQRRDIRSPLPPVFWCQSSVISPGHSQNSGVSIVPLACGHGSSITATWNFNSGGGLSSGQGGGFFGGLIGALVAACAGNTHVQITGVVHWSRFRRFIRMVCPDYHQIPLTVNFVIRHKARIL